MNLAIYDAALVGHHAPHLKTIGCAALKRGWCVRVVLPRQNCAPSAVDELRSVLGHGVVVLSRFPAPVLHDSSPFALLRHHLGIHRAAASALKELDVNPDFVYFPTIDSLDKAIHISGSPTRAPFGGMCMRARFHMNEMGLLGAATHSSGIQKMIFRRLLRTPKLRCLLTIDPTLVAYAEEQKNEEYRKLHYVPDIGMNAPHASPKEAKEFWGFANTDRVVLLYGAISLRKGIAELLDTFGKIEDPRVRLLIVGVADSEASQVLAKPTNHSMVMSGRVKLHTSYADETIEALAFAAADAVWVAYKNHSTMSGVLSQAVCSGVPVITANYGLLPYIAKLYNVGISVDPDDPASTSRRIVELLSDFRQTALYRENARLFAERHRPSNFGTAVCDAIGKSVCQFAPQSLTAAVPERVGN